LSQFVGGMPPALFLFLTGVTLGFLMDSIERKGLAPRERVLQSLRRAGYLFFLAFAFRLQLWVFSGFPAPWQGVFKVDVLNCMGLSIAAVQRDGPVPDGGTHPPVRRAWPGDRLLSPVISGMDWSGVPWIVRNYIIPDYNSFGIFPWGAYLAFGVSAGSVIRAIPRDATGRCMKWAALLGGVLILVCQYMANSPFTIYAKSEFWLNSPAQVLTKVGCAVADGFLRLPVDALRRGRGVELDPPVRRHVAAGVLGAHRTGVRPRFLVVQGQPDGAADRVRRRGGDPADAGDFHHEDPPRKVAGAGQPGLERRAAPGFRRGGLGGSIEHMRYVCGILFAACFWPLPPTRRCPAASRAR
jgi:hypothetical protein